MTPDTDPVERNPAAARERKTGDALVNQRRAAAPDASVWVAASAGTGKTKVLTDRVLSLMLSGTAPDKILCLTFTKAAAAEMSNRLAERLAAWATAEEARLAAALETLTGTVPDEATLRKARQLFAQVLDVPGGMKIQTIHAFCQHLLSRFPLEAGVAPHAQVLDERSAAEMLREAREEVLARAGMGEDAVLESALAEVTARVNESDFGELVGALMRQRGRLARFIREAGGVEALVDRARSALGVETGADPDSVLAEACRSDALDHLGLKVAEDAMRQGTAKEAEKADTLKAFLDADEARRVRLYGAYASLFLTAEGSVRKRLLTNKAAEVPGALGAMQVEAERLVGVRARINAAVTAQATAALLHLGAAILDAYDRRKRGRALLDYDDLILTARDLLDDSGRAAWVLFKLDGGIDHVLIDEAQDTNPEQWQVVRRLTEEFFAGEGAAAARGAGARSVFAVGDGKQSIYSFQRADPTEFARMRDHFQARAAAARQAFHTVSLQHSFRSTDAVLTAVDRVFAQPGARDGVVFDGDGPLHHDPVRVGHAGLVELWPPADPPDSAEPDAWSPPIERQGAAPARQRLARLIAARVRRWTRDDDPEGWLSAKGRQMHPGDVLVLVRRRNAFVEELVRELKLRDVPVAGVDRMVLTEQLAVRDLVALGRFLLLPEDDLTLACVLKGPLIGLSEQRLFELAWDRDGRLWDELRGCCEENGDFERAFTRLSDWLARADFTPPYELYGRLLGAERGRERLVGRLGHEANDPIDEFLALALAYEREHVPSLEGFLHWLEAGQQEVKRDAEHGGDAVRVMTVHGAKGLQAPVVFLPDTLQMPTGQGERILWDEKDGLLLWPPRAEYVETTAQVLKDAARQAQEQEYRRLLYVAMTRAEDRLYVCGYNTRKRPPEGCWYELIEAGLIGSAAEIGFDATSELGSEGWQGTALRLASEQLAEVGGEETEVPQVVAVDPLPDWARQTPAPEPAPPRPLAPSRAPEADPPVRSPLADDAGAVYQRGRLIHRLLQSLPELPAERRRDAGRRFLASPAHGLDATAQAEVLAEALRVIEDPAFAHLFGPGSRAEVPVVGLLQGAAGPEAAHGQIDRLAVDDHAVLVVDYKTNRPPPATAAEVPQVYRRQLDTYRRLLGSVYPDRRVETWLLWTDGPFLMRLDEPAE